MEQIQTPEIPPALRQLLELPEVTDVLLVGASHTYTDSGRGLERAPNPFETNAQLQSAIARLAAEAGARLDLAAPLGDFAIGPLRFHAVLPAGVSAEPLLSVRRHPAALVRLEHLLEVGLFSAAQHQFLRAMLERGDNFLISGATGAGKTTLLSALIQAAGGRTICIEDVAELRPQPPGLTLLSRASNIEGQGAIDTQRLLVNALRMRPDRVMVGEVRGAELRSLLQAMNNGHRGSGATVHASDIGRVADRLIMLGLLAGSAPELTARQVCGAVDWVIQLAVVAGRRQLVEVGRPTLRAGVLVIEVEQLAAAAQNFDLRGVA